MPAEDEEACEDIAWGVTLTKELIEITEEVIYWIPERLLEERSCGLVAFDQAMVDPCTYATLHERYALATF
jgi:hypothetical protein